MPRLVVPNSVAIQNVRAFIANNDPFRDDGEDARISFHPTWVHMEPIALAIAAAWGRWAHRQGFRVSAERLGPKTAYAARMRLFDHIEVPFDPGLMEHEAAGRFVPLTNIRSSEDVGGVIADISVLLETLAAVQYCVSELLRNVLEHSGSPDGAYVCATRFANANPQRVTIAVADCGQGIQTHLGRAHLEAAADTSEALRLALMPGITGAQAGPYGTPDNAGAGLFITRSIAKGSGGYFFLLSDDRAYRLRRARNDAEMTELYIDPLDDPRHDLYEFNRRWQGTAVSVEILTEKIADYGGFFQWIFERIPRRETKRDRIRFT